MTASGAGRPARVAVVALFALLSSFSVIRAAAVADRQARPELAQALWPPHPAVITDRALLAIARAATRGQPVSAATRDQVRRVAEKAPLSPDPYLIEGAIAETEGRGDAAERLLLAARERDPRSRGARYLLAERFFRTGRITEALIEMQALVNLQSRGLEVFVPALVSYAGSPGAVPQLKAFFLKYPRVEPAVLSVLARDPDNADLVLALANVREPGSRWQSNLIMALARDGQFARAQSAWASLSGLRLPAGLFNPDFADIAAPPPFNWAFPESSEGIAEPDGSGGVDVLYYGRAKAILARQLLLLPAGKYRLAMNVARTDGEAAAIRWTLRCATAGKLLAQLPLRPGPVAGQFVVPAGCTAQWLELEGIAGETPGTSELKLAGLRLTSGQGT